MSAVAMAALLSQTRSRTRNGAQEAGANFHYRHSNNSRNRAKPGPDPTSPARPARPAGAQPPAVVVVLAGVLPGVLDGGVVVAGVVLAGIDAIRSSRVCRSVPALANCFLAR